MIKQLSAAKRQPVPVSRKAMPSLPGLNPHRVHAPGLQRNVQCPLRAHRRSRRLVCHALDSGSATQAPSHQPDTGVDNGASSSSVTLGEFISSTSHSVPGLVTPVAPPAEPAVPFIAAPPAPSESPGHAGTPRSTRASRKDHSYAAGPACTPVDLTGALGSLLHHRHRRTERLASQGL